MATVVFCDRCKSEKRVSTYGLKRSDIEQFQPVLLVDLCEGCLADLREFVRPPQTSITAIDPRE